MWMPGSRKLIGLTMLTVSIAAFSASQQKEDKNPKPLPSSDPASGEQLYRMYCAVCHGKDGRGDGPAATELKTPPPDLTTLARRHGGKFPDDYVTDVLRNGVRAPAHGTTDMPVWGPLFGTVGGTDQTVVNTRIMNLITYLKSLQLKNG